MAARYNSTFAILHLLRIRESGLGRWGVYGGSLSSVGFAFRGRGRGGWVESGRHGRGEKTHDLYLDLGKSGGYGCETFCRDV